MQDADLRGIAAHPHRIGDAATKSTGDYIENFSNVERRHSHLAYLNPVEFELRSQIQQQVA